MKNALLILVLLVGGVTLLPIEFIVFVLAYPFDKKSRVINWYSKIWGWYLIHGVVGSTVKIEGRENIEKGKSYVIVANHCTLYDIPMIQLLNLNFRWVSKREVLWMPVIGMVLAMQRSITIKRGDAKSARAMMTKGTELLKSGVSVAVFPEGTRSKTGKVGEFKAGAFIMAKSADCEVLPLYLYNSYDMVNPKKWRTRLRVKILPPMKIEGKVGEFSKKLNEQYRQELD